MNLNSNHLMGTAEAVACLVLAGFCITLAVSGHAIAWLFGFGSLTFAWDLWRRFGRAKTDSGPMGQHDR
ncbi:hypothetical protein ACFWNK_33695 [Streptomyces sp. NPDC058417]|uniref:hypothetical protein n=1 Tax=unclassified Streptomyces TaxID=2593676 RepID=UPI0036674E08